MTEWDGRQNGEVAPRIRAITTLAQKLDENDARYLAGEIDRETWINAAKEIDEKLTVAGLRLAVRPWVRN